MINPSNTVQGNTKDLFKPIWSTPPRRSTSQWLDLMQRSPRTDALHKIASDVSVTPYKLFVKYTEPKKEIKKHISLELLERPCPDTTITKTRLFYLTEMYLLSPAGEAFWLMEKNFLGAPTEIYIVPPNWVVQTPTKSIPYFRVLPQGNTSYQMVYVDPEDIIWFKDPDLLYPYGRGRGRAEGIGDEIETDEYMAKWQKSKFFNGAIPSYVGMMPGADKDTIDRTTEQWNAEVGGFRNGHKTKFLNWDAKIQKLSDNEQEMDYIESRKFLRDTCLQHYSMSGELFGILENANRSTIDLVYELYAKNTLSIQLKNFDDVLNRQFFPLFDDKLYIEHENVIPTDKDYALKQAESGLKNGGWLVDEYRIATGKDPLPGKKGHILYTPLNMMPTNIDDEDVVSNSPAVQNNNPKSKSFSEKRKTHIWKVFDKTAAKYERPFEKALKKYFQAQQDRITKSLSEKSYIDITKDVTSNPDDLLNWVNEDKLLKDALSSLWMQSLQSGFDNTNNMYNLDNSLDIANPLFTEWIKNNGLNKAKGINDTTKKALSKSLADGIDNGDSIIKLRDRISDLYSGIKQSRAMTIARTETVCTINYGSTTSYKQAGIEKHEWLSSRDGRVRESHADIDGEIVEIDKPFSNGLLYPGDESGDASEVCNCRCTTVPVFEEGDENNEN